MIALNTYDLEPIEDVADEQEQFLSILYHDARGGNAIRMLLGEAQENGHPYVRHFANKDWKKIGYSSMNYNAYCTVNTFKSYKRVADEVFNYSGIFIDLDCHEYKSEAQLDKIINKTKNRLSQAYKSGSISAPTMITSTGRGLGIFYILKSSISNTQKSKKSIKYLNDVRAALTAKYKKLLDGTGLLEVDTTVGDAARVCRMPLTMNKKINRWCRLIHIEYVEQDDDEVVRYYDLRELAEQNHLFDEINEIRKQLRTRKVIALDAYRLPFLTIRLQKLELLQEARKFDCTGYREYMNFIYYNAAKQIYGMYAGRTATEVFNDKFNEPLGYDELDHVYATVDDNNAPTGDYSGFYKLSDSWIVETLEVTEDENSVCMFGSSKRQIERQKIKEANVKKRAERNQEIADYIVAHPEQTYPAIANLFGVSESMIYRICKLYDIKRNKNIGTKAEIIETQINTEVQESLQNLAQSLLGVLSSVVAVDTSRVNKVKEKQDGLIQAYYDLYMSVTNKRKRRRAEIPGQLTFNFRSDGTVDYYMIS